MSHYEKAWQAVVERVARAALSAGRAPANVQLLAVSKTFPADAIRSVYALGQRAFGENYVQEGVAKIDALGDLPDVEWHMIGPMQSNKTAPVASAFDCPLIKYASPHTRSRTVFRTFSFPPVTTPNCTQ